MMGDDVTVRAEWVEMSAFFGAAQGEFPKAFASRIVAGGEEDFVVLHPQEGVFFDFDEFFSRLFNGELFGCVCLAKVFDRAEGARGIAGRAESLPKFHEGGVEKAGGFLIEEFSGRSPDGFLSGRGVDGLLFIEKAGEDAGNIPINNGCGLIEGEATDSSSGVSSDAG